MKPLLACGRCVLFSVIFLTGISIFPQAEAESEGRLLDSEEYRFAPFKDPFLRPARGQEDKRAQTTHPRKENNRLSESEEEPFILYVQNFREDGTLAVSEETTFVSGRRRLKEEKYFREDGDTVERAAFTDYSQAEYDSSGSIWGGKVTVCRLTDNGMVALKEAESGYVFREGRLVEIEAKGFEEDGQTVKSVERRDLTRANYDMEKNIMDGRIHSAQWNKDGDKRWERFVDYESGRPLLSMTTHFDQAGNATETEVMDFKDVLFDQKGQIAGGSILFLAFEEPSGHKRDELRIALDDKGDPIESREGRSVSLRPWRIERFLEEKIFE